MTQIEYLKKKYAEATPAWLKSYSKGQAAPLAEFLHSRIVYYPGSAWDWHPIEVFGGSRSAHCFIYVDYLQPEDEVISHLQGQDGQTLADQPGAMLPAQLQCLMRLELISVLSRVLTKFQQQLGGAKELAATSDCGKKAR